MSNTSPYFRLYSQTNEQDLLEDLIIESIRAYGFDSYYIPRKLDNFSEVFRESTSSTFDDVYPMEMFLKTNLKFGGDQDFMSKQLDLEIRDQIIFTVAQKVFKDETEMVRPEEGSLVYLPLDGKCYQIKFVEHQDVFYQLGKLMVWDLQCELLEYNGERFNTGIPAIDAIAQVNDLDDNEENSIEDWNDQSSEIEDVADQIIDWDENDPLGFGGTV